MSTKHHIINGDSRRMNEIKDKNVHLIVTSPHFYSDNGTVVDALAEVDSKNKGKFLMINYWKSMCLVLCFSIDNWLTLISLCFVALGGGFALWQWRKNLKIRRAEFINQILEKLRFDEELIKTMYIVDYKQDWYDVSFHDSEFERVIDKLFAYLDYICYLKTTRNITNSEFHIFQYEIHRVCISYSSKAYCWNLYHFSKKNETVCSFQYLIDYGIKAELFPKDFKKNTTLYSKTLNW